MIGKFTHAVIEAREVRKAGDIQVRTLPCRVQKIERPTDDVVILHLKLPANERLQFLPGQYLDILLKDGTRRSLSMANPPHDDGMLELHLRNYGGPFSTHVFTQMKEKDILRFEAPLGTFFLREDSDKPIILLASGTGFAPISLVALAATLSARLYLKHRIDAQFGTYAGPFWLVPLRDLLSFAVFVNALFGEIFHRNNCATSENISEVAIHTLHRQQVFSRFMRTQLFF